MGSNPTPYRSGASTLNHSATPTPIYMCIIFKKIVVPDNYTKSHTMINIKQNNLYNVNTNSMGFMHLGDKKTMKTISSLN